MSHRFSSPLSAFVALVAGLVFASMASAALVEGKDYSKTAAAQPSGTPGKIEVIEFFSYGCPHCYELHPHIMPWAKELPANVAFVRVPLALGRREWGALSRAYYALQSMGELARLDTALFDAIHKDRIPLFDEESLTVWLSRQGVDAARFSSEYNSQPTTAKVMKAEQMARDYRISAVPTLAVGGQYIVIGHVVAGNDTRLVVARELVDKVAAGKQ
jgi:protein dithiol oxidoreductase (disulfide-forming)